MPWDHADAQVDLQEDLALVRVSAEALGVPLNDVDAAICAAGGNWQAAMQVGLQAAAPPHPGFCAVEKGLCCRVLLSLRTLLQHAAWLEGMSSSQGCAACNPLDASSVQSMTMAGACKRSWGRGAAPCSNLTHAASPPRVWHCWQGRC